LAPDSLLPGFLPPSSWEKKSVSAAAEPGSLGEKAQRMLEASLSAPARFRVTRARAYRSTINLSIRKVQASPFDLRLHGDPWILDRGNGTLAICIGDRPLAQIAALALDVPSLNQRFDVVRHRRPRRRR
jgi:hypothetical protein